MALEVLIVDDEADIRDLVAGVLEDEGYSTRGAANSDEVFAALADRRPSLVLLDVWLHGSRLDGLDLLVEIKRRDPTLPVVVISGHGNIETAVTAVKRGASDFLEKPFEANQLVLVVARATETERLRRENETLRSRIGFEEELTGNSAAINNVRATLKRVAATGSRVLITGPAGAGKEVAARLLHQWSARTNGPFIVVSSARMAPERVEEELFGTESGGDLERPGLLERAHGGTLFLDEVADMPITTQGKILRVMTEQTFARIGGSRLVRVDVRVISSTARNLQDEIGHGRFREDLLYRLNVVPVHLPPLAERRDDIPPLVNHFLARYAAERRIAVPDLAPETVAALQAYDWPGNVRQLRNVVERTLILAPPERLARLDPDLLPPEVTTDQQQLSPEHAVRSIIATPLREAREAFEREYLKAQIRRFSGNVSRTAAFIGMERSALHRKLKTLGLTENDREDDQE